MKITEISINRPIAIIMVVLACVLAGIFGYRSLGADLFPQANVPVVVINTIYPGAGTEEIEKDVSKPIEDAVSGLSGVDKVRTTISEGISTTVVMFKLSADANATMIDTQKALDGIANMLPKDATRPTLFKYDQNDQPVVVATLSGEKSFEEIYNTTQRIKEKLDRIEGVGKVEIFGAKDKELIIRLDKSKLAFYGLSVPQVAQRLQADNISIPGGTISQTEQDKTVRVVGEFKDINEVKSFRIQLKDGFVQLGDIAQVTLEYPKSEEISRANTKTAIGMAIKKQSDANVVETGQKVKDELEKLKPSIKGVDLKIVQDATKFITSSLNETKRNLIEGIFTTALVLLIFLRQWRSVFVVLVSIPTSLVSTFLMMYVFGFTFNILTLMGLALCVGILVDDSVVVLENIHRHLIMGKDSKAAALEGRNEIGMAAIAITLCDVVVFAPIAFMSGIVGQYFKQFGLTVVFATLFSLLVSFTLTPMLASRMFKKEKEKKISRLGQLTISVGEKVRDAYKVILTWSLNNRLKIVSIIVTLLFVSIMMIPLGFIGSEFIPSVDEGEVNIDFDLSPGSTLNQTDEKARIIESFISKIPEKDYFFTKVGSGNQSNKGSIYLKLIDKEKRKRTQKQVVEEIRKWGKSSLTGVSFIVSEPSLVSNGYGDKPVIINISGSSSEVLTDLAKKVEKILKNTPGTVDVTNSFEQGQPEISINVNRVEAAKYGITAFDVSNTVRASIEGAKAGVFRKDGEEYDIKVKMFDSQVVDMNALSNILVVNNFGQSVSLGQIASIGLSDSPTSIKRIDKQRLASVTANLLQGYTLGDITDQVQNKVNALVLPEGYKITLSGEQELMSDSFKSLIQVLIFSVLLVYMILAVLYESLLTPLVRILALPVGAIGALLMLAITGKSLNILSMIGLIMLDGLAAKNGTLLIDYTNTLMNRGVSLRDALYEAGTTRLKPIFMTSVTMIVGMLPTALSFGDGSEYKSGMAVVIIGGMITSTIFSPILLPVAYTLIDDLRKWGAGLFKKKVELRGINNILEPEGEG